MNDFNTIDMTGNRLKALADMEHEDEAQPPIVYHSHGPALSLVMDELRLESPHPHGLHSRQHFGRYCAPCDDWREYGNLKCQECGAPWERVS